MSDKEEDAFNWPTRDSSNEKLRFLCEKIARSRDWQEKESHRIRQIFIVD